MKKSPNSTDFNRPSQAQAAPQSPIFEAGKDIRTVVSDLIELTTQTASTYEVHDFASPPLKFAIVNRARSCEGTNDAIRRVFVEYPHPISNGDMLVIPVGETQVMRGMIFDVKQHNDQKIFHLTTTNPELGLGHAPRRHDKFVGFTQDKGPPIP